jgi:hypothetical protein
MPSLQVSPNALYGSLNGKDSECLQAALREVDLSPEQASAVKAALARQARELTAPSCSRRHRLMRPCRSALRI